MRLPGERYGDGGRLKLDALGDAEFRVFHAIREGGPRSTKRMARDRVASEPTVRKGLAGLRELGLLDDENDLVPDADARLIAIAAQRGLDLADRTQAARHARERHYTLDEPAWLALAGELLDEIAREHGTVQQLGQRVTVVRMIQRAGCRAWSRATGDDGRRRLVIVDDKQARDVLGALLRFLRQEGAIAKDGRVWRALPSG